MVPMMPTSSTWQKILPFLLVTSTLSAAAVPEPAPAASVLPWRSAPIYAADIRSLAIHPDSPQIILAGTSAGQVYRSEDGGRSWVAAGADLPFPGWVVGALRFDPERKGRLWASLRGIWSGGHVASSDDLGRTWSTRSAAGSGLPNEPVYTLVLPAGRPGTIYAGTLSGVYGTRDSGASWQPLTRELPEVQKVTSLWSDPANPDSLIAGTWRRAYKSDDGGKSWRGVFDGMVLDSEVFSLTSSSYRPGELWASTCGWVYKSGDGGIKWDRHQQGLTERRTLSFAILPNGRLLAGTVAGLYASDDGGLTFVPKSDPALSVTAIAWSGESPARLILGTEGGGVWLSPDGGESFGRASSGLTNARIGALAASPAAAAGNGTAGEVLAAVNHAGPLSGIYASRDGGATFNADFTSFPTVLDLAYYKKRLYAATEKGLFERRGTGWHVLMELGEGRFEQLVVGEGRLIARTPTRLYELVGAKFRAVLLAPGLVPRSAALWSGALWVSDGQKVHRLATGAPQAAAVPSPGGRLERLDDQLLFVGPGGAWSHDPQGGWTAIATGASRLLPTGHPRYAALLVSGDTVRLYDRETRKLQILDVPVPARDLVSVTVAGDRLMLGTSGYGLLVRELEMVKTASVDTPAGNGEAP
jgi:hypothetical protein